jgi:hypothetical protein
MKCQAHSSARAPLSSTVRRQTMRHRIYVTLVGRPEVFRAVDAMAVGSGRMSIVGPMPAEECWQFTPGEIVDCEHRRLPDGTSALVAVSSATSEFRARRAVFACGGAIVGALLGLALTRFRLPVATTILIVGACSAVMAFVSARWGDGAWDALARRLR